MKNDVIPNSLACFVAYLLGFAWIYFMDHDPAIFSLIEAFSLASVLLFVLVFLVVKIFEKIWMTNLWPKYLIVFILILPNLFFIKSLAWVISITKNPILYYYLDVLFASGALLVAYWVVIDLKEKVLEIASNATKNVREMTMAVAEESVKNNWANRKKKIFFFIKKKRIDTFMDALFVIFTASAIGIWLNYLTIFFQWRL